MRLSPGARRRAAERRRERQSEPGRDAWVNRGVGNCAVCGKKGPLVRHHVLLESLVRRFGGDPWDLRNALDVGAPLLWGGMCTCHDGHHHPGVNDTRIPVALVPPAAVAFTREVLGEVGADVYFERRYRK